MHYLCTTYEIQTSTSRKAQFNVIKFVIRSTSHKMLIHYIKQRP